MEEGSATKQSVEFHKKSWWCELTRFAGTWIGLYLFLTLFEALVSRSGEVFLSTTGRSVIATGITLCVIFLMHVEAFNELVRKCRVELDKKETDLESARQKALQPRCVSFMIDDPKLINSDYDGNVDTVKYVLVGILQVTEDERLIAAEEYNRTMRVQEYDPKVHSSMVRSPWYKKLGLNPRTGHYDLKILGEFYEFERVVK